MARPVQLFFADQGMDTYVSMMGVLQCLGLCLAKEFSVFFAETLDGSCLVISCGGCKHSMSQRNRAVRAG